MGYVDGSIRFLDVTADCDSVLLITVREIMVDLRCDGLSVSGMDFGKTSQVDLPSQFFCSFFILFCEACGENPFEKILTMLFS